MSAAGQCVGRGALGGEGEAGGGSSDFISAVNFFSKFDFAVEDNNLD